MNSQRPFPKGVFSLPAEPQERQVRWVSASDGLRLLLLGLLCVAPGSHAGTVLTWGNIAAPPAAAQSNVVAVAGGLFNCIALKNDGTVIGWGTDCCGQDEPPLTVTQVTQIAASYYHCLALRADGTVAAWGWDGGGECDVPAGLSNVLAVAAGGVGFSLALKSDGTVAAWGDNTWGECNVPAGLTNAIGITAGYSCSLALLADGTVTGWGDNEYGQLNIPAGLSNVVFISAAERHVAALLADGTVAAWGDSTWGQCNVPAGLANVTNLVAGGLHNLALTASGQLVAWGCNNSGQCSLPLGINSVVGLGAGYSLSAVVADLDQAPPIIMTQPASIAAYVGDNGLFQTVAVGAMPLTYQWFYQGDPLLDATNSSLAFTNLTTALSGAYSVLVSNSYGAFTLNATLTVTDSKPIILSQPANQTAYPGSTVTFQVSANGNKPLTYQWLFNGASLAHATNAVLVLTNVAATNLGNYAVRVTNPAGATLSANAALAFLCVVTWGQTNNYDLASVPLDLTNVVAVAAGAYHSAALKSNGRVVVWGNTSYGLTSVPASVTNVVAIAAGGYHTMALKTDGTVVSWGDIATVPSGLTNVIAIAAGLSLDLALKSNGTVVAWGSASGASVPAGITNMTTIAASSSGAFGAALSSNKLVLTWGSAPSTNGMTNVVALAGGQSFLLALKADGKLVASGLTAPPASLSNVVSVTAGTSTPLILESDGTVTNWTTSAPAAPAGLSNVLAVASGYYHCLAIIGVGQPTPSAPLTNPTRKTGNFSVSLSSQSGRVYALEYKDSLSGLNWTPLPLAAGGGGPLTLSDSGATNTHRFYRVRRW